MTDDTSYIPPAGALGVFLDQAQRAVGKTDADMAQALGFVRANVYALIKAAKMKMPIAKTGALAEALRLPPGQVLHKILEEYFPREVVEEIDKTGGFRGLSEGERRLLEAYRALTKGVEDVEPRILDGDQVLMFVTT